MNLINNPGRWRWFWHFKELVKEIAVLAAAKDKAEADLRDEISGHDAAIARLEAELEELRKSHERNRTGAKILAGLVHSAHKSGLPINRVNFK